MKKLEDILQSAAYARPGYVLATFKEAAAPVFRLNARVLTLAKKPLNPIEEGYLRAISAGLTNTGEISQFLGLPPQLLTGTLAALNAKEYVHYSRATSAASASVSLTSKGRIALAELISIVPEERMVRLAYDPIQKKVIFAPTSSLWKPAEVRESGRLELPLCGARKPEASEVSLNEVDKILKRLPRRDDAVPNLLGIQRIERTELNFIPCLALYYRAVAGSDVQVAFAFEDGFEGSSNIFDEGYELAFSRLGGPELIGSRHVSESAQPENLSALFPDTDSAAQMAQLTELEQEIASSREQEVAPQEATIDANAEKATKARSRLRDLTQRFIRCHEHPKMLEKALSETSERLLIISPWVRAQVVDKTFRESLEKLLKKGVKIHIGYGLAEEDGSKKQKDAARSKLPISDSTKRDFDRLARTYTNFKVYFVGNTHRKHLVSDQRFAIVSSFNWLSFKGSTDDRARDELGFMVTEPENVEKLFIDGIELLQKGYDHPTQ
ncbi:phospholipase D-like domain-containing protein [Paraburkholderia sp. J10-1]|uniref:phospholipase D-like domain-containing protein n=1 Tax=Paraburkholderia sp. J10-1 TaxID=2805430 RepID=UPI002AB73B5D|nr:phospholipase D-like domain-containing protein [Paraburkholderia sp. J10-1]